MHATVLFFCVCVCESMHSPTLHIYLCTLTKLPVIRLACRCSPVQHANWSERTLFARACTLICSDPDGSDEHARARMHGVYAHAH